jgi:hypothetical protein
MVLFFENGRLGNQLFQYSGLKKEFQGHKIILLGFSEFFHVIKSRDQIFRLPLFLSKKRFYLLIKKALNLLVKLKVITHAWETNEFRDNRIIKVKGLFKNIIYVSSGFFQGNSNCDLVRDLTINEELVKLSKCLLEHLNIAEKEIIFLHIRRGDYLSWPSKDNPAVLSISWYLKSIEFMRKEVKNPAFLIFTDDFHYANDFFGREKDMYIINNDYSIDFTLMSICDHGILSASSFAWWASVFVRGKSDNSILIAPDYWIGHREKKWWPIGLKANWITYL